MKTQTKFAECRVPVPALLGPFMHTDRKIGFAMGILLIGIVAALFFRNEPLTDADLPSVRREKELNERLRERDVAVYLDDSDAEDTSVTEADSEPPWTLRDVLRGMSERNKAVPAPVGSDRDAQKERLESGGIVISDAPDEKNSARPIEKSFPESGPFAILPDRTLPPFPRDAAAEQQGIPSAAIPSESAESSFQVPEEFDEYIVKYGDTLSGIAQKMLGSQSRYQEIYEANRDRMSSPDRLDVGKPLRIPRIAQNAPKQI
jgi:hypothetical protein